MTNREILALFAVGGVVALVLLAKRNPPPPPAVGRVDVTPPITAGRENHGFMGNPISAARPNEIFGAPQPPISMDRFGEALSEQGLKYGLGKLQEWLA